MKDVTPPKTPPLAEGKVRKGGHNQGPSQVKTRPAAPGAMTPAKKGGGKAVAVVKPNAPANAKNMLAVIAEIASNPAVPVEKMQAVLAMQREIMVEEQRRDFNAAYAALQEDLSRVTIRQDRKIEIRDKNKPDVVRQSTPYATFNGIMKIVGPLLQKHGFTLSFATEPSPDNSRLIVIGNLDHAAGGHRSTRFPLPIEESGSKNNVQGWGSSQSYGKRYTTVALLNIISEAPEDADTDGHKGEFVTTKTGKVVPAAEKLKLVTDDQATTLRDTMEACGVSTKAFTDFYGVKVAELPADLYDAAITHCKEYAERRRNAR